ncbi:MAG: type IX secretion system membrane protein PorP/SprF [Bacteroidales bacterium]|nr:type IX secretion system membrane protein PorP/SprF [Bacteroidales bacterium]
MGVSIPYIFGYKQSSESKIRLNHEMLRYRYFVTTGFNYSLNSQLKIQPSILTSYENSSLVADVNINALFMETFLGGLSFRPKEALVILIGSRIGYQAKVCLSYDLGIGDMSNYHNGSVELNVQYKLGYKVKASNPGNFLMMHRRKNIICFWMVIFEVCVFSLWSQKFYTASKLPLNTSQYNEYAPVIYKNNLIFISDRKNDWLKTTTDLEGNSLSDIYSAKQTRPGRFGNLQNFSSELNTRFYEGPLSFSKDGKTVFFTRSIDVDKKFNSLNDDTTYGIFSAELVNDIWTNITPFPYNSYEYNVGFPFLSDDGKQLFFCSQAPEGKGGFDIYVLNLKTEPGPNQRI